MPDAESIAGLDPEKAAAIIREEIATLIGWQYGSPARYALHRLVTGATASAGGLTPLFEVEPFIRPGFVTGSTAVILIRPPIRAMLLEPQYGGGAPRITQGASFRFIQTLG